MIRILILLIISSFAFGANHYVRDGGSGDGSAWNNAWDNLPASLTRGDTYYVADGTYSSYTFDDSESGSSVITVKKATESDHGTETGWSSAYGDGLATFGQISFEEGYFTFDGNITTIDTYGFRVNGPTGVGISQGISIYDSANPIGNVIIRSVDVYFSASNESRGIKFNAGLNANCTVDHVRVYNPGNDGLLLHTVSNITISDIYVIGPNTYGGSSVHPDAFEIQGNSSENTIKNSRFNWNGQGIFWGEWPPDPSFGTWYIYGNVFWVDYGETPYSSCSAIKNRSSNPAVNVRIYNNSFYNCLKPYSLGGAVTGIIKNNVVYGMTGTSPTAGAGSCTHDYNFYETGDALSETHVQTGSDPYASVSTSDFTLSAATDAGDNSIGSTYNTDRLDNTRGGDGTWDRGAYEYGEGSDVTPPTSTRILTFVPVDSGKYAISNISSDIDTLKIYESTSTDPGGSEDNLLKTIVNDNSSWDTTLVATPDQYFYYDTYMRDDSSNSVTYSDSIWITLQLPPTSDAKHTVHKIVLEER